MNKTVRFFEEPKYTKYEEVLPYSVANVEYGDDDNYVNIIIRAIKKEGNKICILFSFPVSPHKIQKMYDLDAKMTDKVKIVGFYA